MNNKISIFQAYAEKLYESYRNAPIIPSVTGIDSTLDMDDAYKIQSLFTDILLNTDKLAGYKAALTSKRDQERFAVDMPISGVLFESGEMENHSRIQLAAYNIMLVEAELGYRIGEKIAEVIKDRKELESKISTIFPVIELPNVRLQSFKNAKLIDAIAANVFSENYILGKEYPFSSSDLSDFPVTLSLDEKVISDASISDSMVYQMELLMWLINKQLENGREINVGEILITGAIGKVNIGESGSYVADYGQLGRIEFEVIENHLLK